MAFQANSQPKSWQRKVWVQVLAILLGVVPIYTISIMIHLSKDQPYTLNEIFFYTTVVGSIMIVVLLILLRYLCGEKILDLNLKQGKWWQDVIVGIVLAALTLGLHNLLQGPLNMMFPREPISGLGDFFNGITQNLWLFALFIGPVFPLIISHYLYDAIQIIIVVTLIQRGVIQF